MAEDDEYNQQEQIHETLMRIFPDKRNYQKVVLDLEELSTLGTEEISFNVYEIAVGLRLNLKISAKCLKVHGIEFRRQKGDVVVDFVLMPDYPFDNPRIYFQNTVINQCINLQDSSDQFKQHSYFFCYPSLADGRDFFGSVMAQIQWHSQIGVSQIFNEVINYLKQISRRVQDVEFLMKEGAYQVGEEYDMEYFLNLSTCELFSSQEIVSKKKFTQKILIVTHYKLLEFQLSPSSNRTGLLEISENLSDLVSFGVDKKSKDGRIQFKWVNQTNKKKTRDSEFLIDQEQKFLGVLTERVNQVQKLSTKKNIAEEEVTAKQYENMDLEQILENIVIMESELAECISLSSIETLMVLYQKAIEFLSAIADPNYKLFVNKLHELLTREDVQQILKSKESPNTSSSQSTTKTTTTTTQSTTAQSKGTTVPSNNKQTNQIDPKNLPSDEFDSIFGELSQSVHTTSESIEQQRKNKEAELRKIEEVRKRQDIFNAASNSLLEFDFENNSGRYVRISSVKSSQHTETLFFDTTEKRKLVRTSYAQSARSDFTKDAAKTSHFPSIIAVSNPEAFLIYNEGYCNLLQLAEMRPSTLTSSNLMYILYTLISRIKAFQSAGAYLSDIKPANIFFYPKRIASSNNNSTTVSPTELLVDFGFTPSNVCCDEKEYPTMFTSVFMNPDLHEKLQKEEPIARHEIIQNQLYMVARSLQFAINGNVMFEDHAQVSAFISSLSDAKYGATFKSVMRMLLQERVVNDIDFILSELSREEFSLLTTETLPVIPPYFIDREGYALMIQESEVKQGLQESKFAQEQQEQLFETRHGLGEKAMYMIETIGGEYYPLYPQLMHEKVGTFKEILEKSEAMINGNPTVMRASKIVFDSIIRLLRVQGDAVACEISNVNVTLSDVQVEEALVLLNLLQLKAIVYKWNGLVKVFREILVFAVDACEKLIGKQNAAYAMCLTHLGQAEAINSQVKVGFAHLVTAYSIRKNLIPNHPSTVYALLSIAESLRAQERFDEAILVHEKIAVEVENMSESNKSSICVGRVLLSHARTLKFAKKYNEAYNLISTSIEAIKTRYGEESTQMCEAFSETADLFSIKHQPKDALTLNEKSLTITKAIFGDSHPIVADHLVNVSYTLRNMKDFDQSMNYLVAVMEIRKKFFGESHPIIADTFTEQANTLTFSNQFKQATEFKMKVQKIQDKLKLNSCILNIKIDLHKLALQIRESLYGVENATTLSSLEAIVMLLLVQQMFEEASEYQSKVIDAQEKYYGVDCLPLAKFLEKIAFQYESNKNFDVALPYRQRVLEIREKRCDQDSHHQRLQAMLNLSYCYDQCRQFEESMKQKVNALNVMREQLGPEHKKVAHQLMSIAETNVQLEKTSEAFDSLVEALALIHKNGLDKNDTTKCLRVMTTLLVCEGEKGNMEAAFSLSDRVVQAVTKQIPEDPSYSEFISAQCSEILGNLLDQNN